MSKCFQENTQQLELPALGSKAAVKADKDLKTKSWL